MGCLAYAGFRFFLFSPRLEFTGYEQIEISGSRHVPLAAVTKVFAPDLGKSILRSFSTDFGRSWTPAVVTNFPDASSKFFVVNTTSGDYAMVSNPNPKARNPLCLSLSKDGLVYKRMAVIEIPAKLEKTDWQYRKHYHTDYEAFQYPHAMEHDGSLIILFSRRKQTIESVKIPMEDVNKLWN